MLVVALTAGGWVTTAAEPVGAAGFTVRASTGAGGGEGNGLSTDATLSDDGRFVAFTSAATNLVAGDSNGVSDVFVHDRNTGTTSLVSIDAAGGPSDGLSETAFISGNGRYVAFASEATDLVVGDTNGSSDIFVRDLQTATTTRVSLTDADTEILDGSSYEPSINDTGTRVEFGSDSPSIVIADLNDSEDIFVRDLVANTTRRVSVASNGDETDFGAYEGVISGDGSMVAFTTDSPLLATDVNDEDDVYRHTIATGSTNRVSSGPTSAGGGGYSPAVSDNGGLITFVSDYDLAGPGADTNFLPDVYTRNVTAGSTTRTSLDSTGAVANDLSIDPSISDDGRYVVYFTLATDLGGTDTNGTFDVWMRDRTLNTNTRVSQDSGGADPNGAAEQPSIAGAGGFVAFQSLATDLGPAGEGTNLDVFVRSLANDITNPTVALVTPAAGASYARGATIVADYSCADDVGGSGIVSCSGTVADGAPISTATLGTHSFTVTATDGQGNVASVTRTYSVVDLTDPTITLTTPIAGASYNQFSTVFADYACADELGGSGIASCIGTVADGAPIDTSTVGAHSFSVTATDGAGNDATTTVGYVVLDVAGPDISIATPIDGATYARGASVLADFACTDEAGGSGVASCVGTVADGAPIDTSTLGVKSFTVTATDNSANLTTRSVSYTVVDATDPTVVLVTPVDGGSYGRGSVVAADYTCSDDVNGSGIASCTGTVADGASIDTSTLGSATFSATAVDQAGNDATVTVTYAVVDVTDPSATIVAPIDGAEVARGSAIAADFSCVDDVGGSGVASCLGTVADGALIDTATLGAKSFSVVVTDAAGNSATISVGYTVVDRTDPTVVITTPTDGASYALGQAVSASYSCADEVGGSGVASCSGTVLDGAAIDTASPGSKSFTVTATDAAGNVTTATVGYTVTVSVLASIGDATLVENDSGAQTVKLGVVLDQAAAVQSTVHYTTQSTGSATAGVDYKAKSGTLTFKPGQVYKVVAITLTPDVVVEGDETFAVVLDTAAGVGIGDSTGLVTVLDDDPNGAQRLAVSDASIGEGDAGSTRKISFVVALAQPASGSITVHYAVSGVTALGGATPTGGADFKLRSGTLAFKAGQRFKIVTVTVYGDTTIESDDTLSITLDSAVGTTISRATGTGTIRTDD